jgi:hypothetical protein
MNRYDTGQLAQMNRIKATDGRTVTYAYGTLSNGVYTPVGTAVFSITAVAGNQGMWVGRTMFSRSPHGPGAATVAWGDRDYLCSVADFLALVGANALPVRGDRITDTDKDGVTMVFELQTPTGEPVWRYSDQTMQTFRLHCKRVV